MGSSISKIYEDYDDYEFICQRLGIEPLGMRDEQGCFLDHMDQIYKDHGVSNFFELVKLIDETPF